MNSIDYIGFDIHKKTISFCAKAQDGRILDEGTIPARRTDLSAWAKQRSRPWWGAMEATLFTGWVYDHLKPLAQELKVAHPVAERPGCRRGPFAARAHFSPGSCGFNRSRQQISHAHQVVRRRCGGEHPIYLRNAAMPYLSHPPPIVFVQPKISSTRLRIRWLMP